MTGTTTIRPADEAAVRAFKENVRGETLCPGDQGYDRARRVFNAMIDKRPAMIVRCAGAADVISAVEFARDHDLPVAVRGGGHSVGGKSVCDSGVLIDLSAMKGLRVDPARRTARAQPGLRLGELDRETQAFGLATPLGVVTNTGIAGLTLGGGIGWLNGRYGLACDNLASVDVITADGRLLTASAEENQDLFWGIRGGGGNFGIVTSFEYRLYPVGPVLGGLVLHPIGEAAGVLRFYREFARASPDELSTVAGLLTGPDGNLVVAMGCCYCGSLTEGERVLEPLRAFGSPVADLIRPMSYVEMQSLIDAAWPQEHCHYWKSGLLRTLSDDAIEIMVGCAAAKPSPLSIIVLQQIHGVAARVDPAETAFPHRSEQHDFGIYAMWSDPTTSKENVEWARESWAAILPFLERGVYSNNLGDEGEERVRAAYGPNYERLVTLKNTYDPRNFFRLNQNIEPTV